MANEVELRALVDDAALPPGERKDAALLLVRLLVSEIPEPGDDDAEVLRLRHPWPRATETERWLAESFSEATLGRSVNGYSLKDAKLAAHEKVVKARLKLIAEDTTEHLFVVEAALSKMREPTRVQW